MTLEEALEVSGMSASDLARTTGIDRRIISGLKTGRRPISVDRAQVLSDALGVTVNPTTNRGPGRPRVPSFKITHATGLHLGTYKAEDEAAALDAYARDAGHSCFADLPKKLVVGTLEVAKVED